MLLEIFEGSHSEFQVTEAARRNVLALVGRLHVNQAISVGRVEQTMRVLDSGQLDALIERMVPESKPAAPERFADVKPFDHEAWKSRHESR